jgi:hypothetical protein
VCMRNWNGKSSTFTLSGVYLLKFRKDVSGRVIWLMLVRCLYVDVAVFLICSAGTQRIKCTKCQDFFCSYCISSLNCKDQSYSYI